VQFNHYGFVAAQYAAALANAPATPSAYQTVIDEFVRPLERVEPRDVPAIKAWADQLRGVFQEPDLDQRVSMVNALLQVGVNSPFVSRHDHLAPHLHYVRVDADLLSRVRARTAAGLAHVLCVSSGDRLGRCARQACDLVFTDTSRNGGRRFCSLRCANRVRTAQYRARAAASRTRD
jgi:hypothetical protein